VSYLAAVGKRQALRQRVASMATCMYTCVMYAAVEWLGSWSLQLLSGASVAVWGTGHARGYSTLCFFTVCSRKLSPPRTAPLGAGDRCCCNVRSDRELIRRPVDILYTVVITSHRGNRCRPLYLRNKLYDKILKSQNYYSNILRFPVPWRCLVVIQNLLVRPELI